MSDAERERWDARYADVGVGEPVAPEAVDPAWLLAHGRALDLACGRGGVAVWLAGRGLAVDAVDVSAVGLAHGRALAAREGVTVHWIEADLDAGLPVDGPYDMILCRRFRDPTLYSAMVAALAPGGLLAVTVRSTVGDDGGRFRAAPGELRAAFGELETLVHTEAHGEAVLVARRR